MSNTGRRMFTGARRAMLAALCLTAMGVSTAWATQTDWDYEIYGQFDNSTFLSNPGCHDATSTKLSWSGDNDCSPASSLDLTPTGGGTEGNQPLPGQDYSFASGTIFTDAAAIDSGITLTHHNVVISLPAQVLDTTHYLVNFYITDPNNPGGINPISLDFTIHFAETPNQAPCAAAGTPACPDIFVVSGDSINQMFAYDGQNYFLSMFAIGPDGAFSPLSDAACAAAGAASGCLGFITNENQDNPMTFGLQITSERINVPEPGALGMMGLGLLALAGLVVFRRRKLGVE